jgi:hypothetical protein
MVTAAMACAQRASRSEPVPHVPLVPHASVIAQVFVLDWYVNRWLDTLSSVWRDASSGAHVHSVSRSLATRSSPRELAVIASGVLLTDDTDWEEIRELVIESYRVLAPKAHRTARLERVP